MSEVVVRPRWYRNLHLGLCLLSLLMLGTGFITDQGPRLWVWTALLVALAAFWAHAALRTCVRCDERGVHSDRPLSKLTASASWDQLARFVVDSAGVVRAKMRDGELIVVLDPSGDGRAIMERLEDERARRQQGASA